MAEKVINVTINFNAADSLKGLEAIQRELKKAIVSMRTVEKAAEMHKGERVLTTEYNQWGRPVLTTKKI